jgi:hypothetical protein
MTNINKFLHENYNYLKIIQSNEDIIIDKLNPHNIEILRGIKHIVKNIFINITNKDYKTYLFLLNKTIKQLKLDEHTRLLIHNIFLLLGGEQIDIKLNIVNFKSTLNIKDELLNNKNINKEFINKISKELFDNMKNLLQKINNDIICSRIINILILSQNTKFNLNIEKFNVKNILKPIMGPIKKIVKLVVKIGKFVGTIIKTFINVLKQIPKLPIKIGIFIKDVFMGLLNIITGSIKYIAIFILGSALLQLILKAIVNKIITNRDE